jgi:hypothetical protein
MGESRKRASVHGHFFNFETGAETGHCLPWDRDGAARSRSRKYYVFELSDSMEKCRIVGQIFDVTGNKEQVWTI